jgi:hypothetical protein
VAEQADPDDDAAELAAEDQVGAARAQHAGGDGEQERHERRPSPVSLGSVVGLVAEPSKTISTSPTTIRYTPVSNTWPW